MENLSKIIANKKLNTEKLLHYGFRKQMDAFVYGCDILDGFFRLNIRILENGMPEFQVIDKNIEEEYALIHHPDAVGPFVGKIRAECMDILSNIVDTCYESNIFKSPYAQLIIQYVHEKYLNEPEFLWDQSPDNAIFRDAKTKKWYAALLTVAKTKIGIDEAGTIEIIDLKETPENVAALLDGQCFLPAYHMNKKHWYTICLDGSVPIQVIYEQIDKSFNIVTKKK